MMAAGEYRELWEPLLTSFQPVPFGDLAALEAALEEHRPAAFVTEPLQVEAGVRVPPGGYLEAAANLCRKNGALLVLDEVQTGLGRSGSMFAFQREGAEPDILVLAKALGAGLVPIGATLARTGLFDAAYGEPRRAEVHNSTYGGGALACVTGLAVLDALETPGFLERVRATSKHLEARVREILHGHPMVRRTTFCGLLGGLEIEDPSHPWLTWEGLGVAGFDDLPVSGALLLHRMHRRGFLIQICGHSWRTVRLQPPLTVTPEECDALVEALREELDWLKEAGE
jgi:acetylornithine/succinyldiaminopimelate/putrescine aminotransferase